MSDNPKNNYMSEREMSQKLMDIVANKKMSYPFHEYQHQMLFDRFVYHVRCLTSENINLTKEGMHLTGACKIFSSQIDEVRTNFDAVEELVTRTNETIDTNEEFVMRNENKRTKLCKNKESLQPLQLHETRNISTAYVLLNKSILIEKLARAYEQNHSDFVEIVDETIQPERAAKEIWVDKGIREIELIEISDDEETESEPERRFIVENEALVGLPETSDCDVIPMDVLNELEPDLSGTVPVPECSDILVITNNPDPTHPNVIPEPSAKVVAPKVKRIKIFKPPTRISLRILRKSVSITKRKIIQSSNNSKRKKLTLTTTKARNVDTVGIINEVSESQIQDIDCISDAATDSINFPEQIPSTIETSDGCSQTENCEVRPIINFEPTIVINKLYCDVNILSTPITNGEVTVKLEDACHISISKSKTLNQVCLSSEDEDIIQKHFSNLQMQLISLEVDSSYSEKVLIFTNSKTEIETLFLKYGIDLRRKLSGNFEKSKPSQRKHSTDIRKNLMAIYRENCLRLPHPSKEEFTTKSRIEFYDLMKNTRNKIVAIFSRLSLEMDNNPEFMKEYMAAKRKMDENIQLQYRKEKFDVKKYCRKIIEDVHIMSRQIIDYGYDYNHQNYIDGNFTTPSASFSQYQTYAASQSSSPSRDSGMISGYHSQQSCSPYSQTSQSVGEFPDFLSQGVESGIQSDSEMECLSTPFRVETVQECDKVWVPISKIFEDKVPDAGEVARTFSALLQTLCTKKLLLNYDKFFSQESESVCSSVKDTSIDIRNSTAIKIACSHCPAFEDGPIYVTLPFDQSDCVGDDTSDSNLAGVTEKDIHQKMSEFVDCPGDVYLGALGGRGPQRNTAGTKPSQARRKILRGMRRLHF